MLTNSSFKLLRNNLKSFFPIFPSPVATTIIRSFGVKITVDTPKQDELREEYKEEIHSVMSKYDIKKHVQNSLVGRVVSTKCAKTVTIAIHRRKYIPKYQTYLRHTRKVMAHDENEICDVGDIVRILPCLQKSKRKRHEVYEILIKEQVVEPPVATAAAIEGKNDEGEEKKKATETIASSK